MQPNVQTFLLMFKEPVCVCVCVCEVVEGGGGGGGLC